MKYGSGKISKLDYGRTIAACLAYLILLQRDAVAVGIFDAEMRDYQPRTDSLAKIHQICQVLASFRADRANRDRRRAQRNRAAGEAPRHRHPDQRPVRRRGEDPAGHPAPALRRARGHRLSRPRSVRAEISLQGHRRVSRPRSSRAASSPAPRNCEKATSPNSAPSSTASASVANAPAAPTSASPRTSRGRMC